MTTTTSASDELVAAARKVSDLENRVLLRYAAGENAADIAINLDVPEIGKSEVIRIIRDVARDNRTYARNLAVTRQELAKAVAAARPPVKAPAPSVTNRTPGVTGAQRVRETGVAPASAGASPTARKATPMTAATETPKTRRAPARATPPTFTAPAPAPVAPAPAPVEAEAVTPPPAQRRAPDLLLTAARTGPDMTITTTGEVVVSDSLSPTGDDHAALLRRAAASDVESTRALAEQISQDLARLRRQLDVDARAAELRGQIAELDTKIDDLTGRRDALRRELEELLSGDVIVTATSGRLRKPAAEASAGSGPESTVGADEETVRRWALENNYEVPAAGTIPGGIYRAYERTHEPAA